MAFGDLRAGLAELVALSRLLGERCFRPFFVFPLGDLAFLPTAFLSRLSARWARERLPDFLEPLRELFRAFVEWLRFLLERDLFFAAFDDSRSFGALPAFLSPPPLSAACGGGGATSFCSVVALLAASVAFNCAPGTTLAEALLTVAVESADGDLAPDPNPGGSFKSSRSVGSCLTTKGFVGGFSLCRFRFKARASSKVKTWAPNIVWASLRLSGC